MNETVKTIEEFLAAIINIAEEEPAQWFWVGDEESYQRFLKKAKEWKSAKNSDNSLN